MVSPPVSSVKPVGSTIVIRPLGIDKEYQDWVGQYMALAASLDDAQTRKEMKIAFETGDPNAMNSAGQGSLIRAVVWFDSNMNNTDRQNLATIDDNLTGLAPLDQVNFRSQFLFELYTCKNDAQCKKDLLAQLAASTSKANSSPNIPNTVPNFWGNAPKHNMTPEQKFTSIASGFQGWNSWNQKHFKNQRPIFRVYGFQFECKRGAKAQASRVLADIPHFYGTSGPVILDMVSVPWDIGKKIGPVPFANVVFKPDSETPHVGTFIDIDAWIFFVGPVKREGDVKISFMSSNAWTFTTQPNHVVYDSTLGAFPGRISFALFDLGSNQVGAFVVAQGNFSDTFTQTQFSLAGASALEDKIWNDWAGDIKSDCSKN